MNQKFLDEVIRLSFAIERTVASDLDNPYCRSARVLAEQLHKLAAQHSAQQTDSSCPCGCGREISASGETRRR